MYRRVTVPYISALESLDNKSLKQALATAGAQVSIDCNNWVECYPYTPAVVAHIAYSERALAILFEVSERQVKAVEMNDNGRVWEDSCVEFFVENPVGRGYFNFELNAIGTLLAAERESRECARHFSAEQLAACRRYTSLEHSEINICQPSSWYAVEVIPFTLLGLQQAPKTLRANMYKCGDGLEYPHFISWSPIYLDEPNFHCPEYFGLLTFEDGEL